MEQSKANTKFNINWAIAGAIGVGAIVFALINNQQVPQEENSAPVELNTLVVIPLENLGTDSSVNFANGISSDLANGLSRAAKSMNVINLGKRPENLEEITELVGAKSLFFLSLAGTYKAMGYEKRNSKTPQFTDHCFTGEYPIDVTEILKLNR